MKKTYFRPKITNADTTNPEGLFPVVEAAAVAATKGHAVGKAVRKVFGADFSSSAEGSLVNRKEFAY